MNLVCLPVALRVAMRLGSSAGGTRAHAVCASQPAERAGNPPKWLRWTASGRCFACLLGVCAHKAAADAALSKPCGARKSVGDVSGRETARRLLCARFPSLKPLARSLLVIMASPELRLMS